MSQQHQHCRNCGQRIWYRALNAAYVHAHSLSIWCGPDGKRKAEPR